MTRKNILILPGDGIGQEIAKQAIRVLEFVAKQNSIDVNIETGLIGGIAYDKQNTPLSDKTLEKAKSSDAVLLGAVGSPRYDNVERSKRPEAGLLRIRKEMDLFANLRPAICFSSLVESSSLKPEIIKDLDILIVRELTSGVYFGEPRGMEDGKYGKRCIDTQAYNHKEVERIARVAFDLAKVRSSKLTSADKANVMETGKFWRDIVGKIGEREYSDISLEHIYADNCAMQLVRDPKQFDVILTDNLFGDILSDTAAMLTGSLGMLPSASLGAKIDGKRMALYEPVHGSAPDIAFQNKANPLAMILSVAMMFRYSFSKINIASNIEKAVDQTLQQNIRTIDLCLSENSLQSKIVSCSEMTDHVISNLAQEVGA